MVSYIIFFGLTAALAGVAQASRTINLDYVEGAQKIKYGVNYGITTNNVNIDIGEDGKFPGGDDRWNFLLLQDGERDEVKCHLEGKWNAPDYEEKIRIWFTSNPLAWATCGDRGGFKVVCERPLDAAECKRMEDN